MVIHVRLCRILNRSKNSVASTVCWLIRFGDTPDVPTRVLRSRRLQGTCSSAIACEKCGLLYIHLSSSSYNDLGFHVLRQPDTHTQSVEVYCRNLGSQEGFHEYMGPICGRFGLGQYISLGYEAQDFLATS